MANAQIDAPDANVVDLVNTSSIDDVFLALRAHHIGARINLTDDRGREFTVSVQGLYHEDGSGRSLVINGYAKLTPASKMKFGDLLSPSYEAYLNFKGGGRRGWIKVFD